MTVVLGERKNDNGKWWTFFSIICWKIVASDAKECVKKHNKSDPKDT